MSNIALGPIDTAYEFAKYFDNATLYLMNTYNINRTQASSICGYFVFTLLLEFRKDMKTIPYKKLRELRRLFPEIKNGKTEKKKED